MDLRLAQRDLRRLDRLTAEVLVAAVMQDERPPKGVAGMIDWRLSGQLSRLMKQGFFQGALCEVLLLPSKSALPFDKALLFGCGPTAEFDERAYLAVLGKMRDVLAGLKAGHAVVELPGRHLELIAPERAVDLLLEDEAASPLAVAWTLVDTPQAHKTLSERRVRERRKLAP